MTQGLRVRKADPVPRDFQAEWRLAPRVVYKLLPHRRPSRVTEVLKALRVPEAFPAHAVRWACLDSQVDKGFEAGRET